MKCTRLSLFLLGFLLFQFSRADQLDSLLQVIKKPKEDTIRVKELFKVGVLFRSFGILDTSIIYAEQSLAMAKKLNFSKFEIAALGDIGKSYAMLGDFEKAEQFFKEAVRISQLKGTLTNVGDHIMNLGNVKRMSGKESEAMEEYKKSIKILENLSDTVSLMNAYVNLGLSNYNLGDYWQAIDLYKKVLRTLEGSRFRSLEVKTLNNIAGAYLQMGKNNEAEKYYYKVLSIQEKANMPEGLGEIYSNFGVIYFKMNKLDDALKMLNKAKENYEKINHVNGMSIVYHSIGCIYQVRKNYDEGLKYFQRSLELRKRVNDVKGMGKALSNIATIYEEQGKFTDALKLNLEAIALIKQVEDIQMLGVAYCNVGVLFYKQKQFAESERYLKMSLEICQKINDLEGLRDGEKAINKLYDAMGQTAKAYDHYQKYIVYKDSLINKDNIEKSLEAKMQYEFHKKESEAKLEQEKKDAKLEDEKRVQAIVRNSFILGFCLVLILAVVILRGYSNKKKANLLITQQKQEVELQKHTVEEKNREILDSINYAKRIQQTLLANEQMLNQYLPNHFVFFKPKDIVSGDFYWATKHQNKFYLAVCDSTGHGVPGAFMSVLNIGFLTEAINEKGIEKPNEIFNYVREKLTVTISKEGQKDGFDGILICCDLTTNKISYAAANNEPILIRNGEIIELPKDKMPVGVGERKESFNLFEPEIQKGDSLYLYTDGYADQFGGPKGKKFKYKQLNELLLANSTQALERQQQLLKESFDSWKGKMEQVDDVCIIGIRLS